MEKLITDEHVRKLNMAMGIKEQIILDRYECEDCKREVFEIKTIYENRPESIKTTGCICDEVKRNTEFIVEQRLKEYERYSIYPEGYKEKMVRDYKPGNESQRNAYDTTVSFIMNYKDAIEAGEGILFKGTHGTGKTHLAAAISNYLRSEKKKVLFITLNLYFNRIKDGFNSQYGDTRLQDLAHKTMTLAEKADLLILDEVGSSEMTNWEKKQLTELLNSRHGKSTIFTTNMSEEEFVADKILHRSYSRMLERNKEITITGQDHRKANRTFTF